MARIINRYENVLKLTAGQLPAAGAAWWYSGKGDSNFKTTSINNLPTSPARPAGDPGGTGGGTLANAGQGSNIEGEYANGAQLSLVVDAWDTVTAVEICVEVNRAAGNESTGAFSWVPVDLQVADADTLHLDVKPLRFKLTKSDFVGEGDDDENGASHVTGQTALVRIYGNQIGDIVAKRLRVGIRCAAGTVGNFACHAALELVQRYL